MATKKTETAKKPAKKTTTKKEKNTVTFKGRKFTVLEKNDLSYKLTDGSIHFYAKAKDVEED